MRRQFVGVLHFSLKDEPNVAAAYRTSIFMTSRASCLLEKSREHEMMNECNAQ